MVSLANLNTILTDPASVLSSHFGGANPFITSSDWSNDLVYQEPSFQHSVSKFIGGQGLITIATAGIGTGAEGFSLTSAIGKEAARFVRFTASGPPARCSTRLSGLLASVHSERCGRAPAPAAAPLERVWRAIPWSYLIRVLERLQCGR